MTVMSKNRSSNGGGTMGRLPTRSLVGFFNEAGCDEELSACGEGGNSFLALIKLDI
jgi:hypothetical protein